MFLNCHSYFSLRYGTLSPEELVTEAIRRGIKTMVLSDINNTSCYYQFDVACRNHGVKAIFGIEFREGDKFLYLGIAKNEEGIKELNQFLTKHSISKEPFPKYPPLWENCFVVYRDIPEEQIDQLRENEFIGIKPSELNPIKERSGNLSKSVVFAPVTFLNEEGWKVHKLLRCINHNIHLGKLEPGQFAPKDEMFYTFREILSKFELYPEVLMNTQKILDSCITEMPAKEENNRKTFTGDTNGDYRLLSKLAIQGCRRRYGDQHQEAAERVKKELQVIHRLGFSAYFLITWDIIRYAQSVGYYHVGRGSGANSIVAFCLYITDVDPLELDLYFERFINPHRSSPPDFDIDFSWSDRDDVTEYIFNRYGIEHTALLATYNTFKGKSIIRELGKVFGLPKKEIDVIVDEPLASQKHHPYAKYIFHYGKKIEGFPNYLSIHAGGIIISERPLYYHTALLQMPKGFPTTHFDMYGAEDLRFHKYDILSQRGLGHIKDAIDLVRENQEKEINIHQVEKIKKDDLVRAQLKSAQCIGCFYIESPAMRGLLSKLKCEDYVHLVAASSIIRPGVAKSGMMREYIERFHNPDKVKYLHPVFKQNLSETFGVMVYQEDVMKIVHHFAGLDLNESDVLRRIMTGKKKSSDTFRKLMEKYFHNCKNLGYSDDLSKEVWRQIESFSGYSFCKAHSASYAVESFQSLYLKTYFPLEFMVAVINNFGGFYNTELYIHEARMCGARIEAPCVNKSRYLTHIEGKTIYVGLIHIQSLEKEQAQQIIRERERRGPYRSLDNFIQRNKIAREQLNLLIRIGGFRFTNQSKCSLLWETNVMYQPRQAHLSTTPIFSEREEKYELPMLEDGIYDQTFDEIELLGFPLRSPFDLILEKPQNYVTSKRLKDKISEEILLIGYYVTRKPVTTTNGKLMSFGTWVDEEGYFFDTTHFPPVLERYPFLGKGCYEIHGVVVEDFGFPSLEVRKMKKLGWIKDERY
ncbi:MAG: DNA polymerase III subunit alpha [Saprospiraceae bacterium]|nr:DNA polymerase III subunit alpha [Saprospiraceae bacterium]